MLKNGGTSSNRVIEFISNSDIEIKKIVRPYVIMGDVHNTIFNRVKYILIRKYALDDFYEVKHQHEGVDGEFVWDGHKSKYLLHSVCPLEVSLEIIRR